MGLFRVIEYPSSVVSGGNFGRLDDPWYVIEQSHDGKHTLLRRVDGLFRRFRSKFAAQKVADRLNGKAE